MKSHGPCSWARPRGPGGRPMVKPPPSRRAARAAATRAAGDEPGAAYCTVHDVRAGERRPRTVPNRNHMAALEPSAIFRLSGAKDLLINNKNLYDELCARPPGSHDNPTPRKIHKDVHRTFQITPEEAVQCPRCQRLLRLLEAYSCLNQVRCHST